MRYLLTILVVLSFSCKSQTKKNSIDEVAKPVIDTFFIEISKGEKVKSIEGLLMTNENINLADSITINLKQKYFYLIESSGPFLGKRLLKERSIENDIAIYSYLVKFEKKFYRFIFMFYNNGKVTKLYKFLFDDNIDIELEESLKLYVN